MPLTSRLMQVFPTGRTHRIRFTFIDIDTDTEIPGWVVREGRYVYGLEEWYRTHDIPVGAYIELTRGKKPGTVDSVSQPATQAGVGTCRIACGR